MPTPVPRRGAGPAVLPELNRRVEPGPRRGVGAGHAGGERRGTWFAAVSQDMIRSGMAAWTDDPGSFPAGPADGAGRRRPHRPACSGRWPWTPWSGRGPGVAGGGRPPDRGRPGRTGTFRGRPRPGATADGLRRRTRVGGGGRPVVAAARGYPARGSVAGVCDPGRYPTGSAGSGPAFDEGRRRAPFYEAVAGVAEPPGPDESRRWPTPSWRVRSPVIWRSPWNGPAPSVGGGHRLGDVGGCPAGPRGRDADDPPGGRAGPDRDRSHGRGDEVAGGQPALS